MITYNIKKSVKLSRTLSTHTDNNTRSKGLQYSADIKNLLVRYSSL